VKKGAALFVAIAALVWIVIPMLGLFVDLGILYSAKARLQAAVDGAALAAARALNLGQTTAAQASVGPAECGELVLCKFSERKLGHLQYCNDHANVTVVDSPSNANLRQVTVTASTSVPAWFMKYLGFSSTNLTVRPSLPQGPGRHAGAGPFRIDVLRQRRYRSILPATRAARILLARP
jgi:Flp pilus assembly protein TadG